MEIVILADGTFPTSSYPLAILERADKIICCDGAVLKLLGYKKEITPDYIVGDMDSLPLKDQNKYKEIIRFSSCQETNDQTKAFSFALGLIPCDKTAAIHILGATGGREDHTLGNISLLIDYATNSDNVAPFGTTMREGISVDIITDYGIFFPHFNTFTSRGTKGEQISIFSFDSTLRIISDGLKYPTDKVIFDLWWKASLNECLGGEYTLKFNHPAKVLLFRCYPIGNWVLY